ncbi:probable long-chain-alcohol O-fatty-acyltransferase 5 [Argentina anserina]|uniref:probable long-chain-alcohol O-fatty-acyltransferase 5 n=1 Tax=Argentina anserina TaxID=57926 RepID=UPI00217626E4|nr:probable long-chain-alcohol O-fatty-acyltransferase 5 [Potentilla anserina]
MEDELKNLVKVWITTTLCLSYCHYIVSILIPKGLLRLIFLLPVFYLFITAPLNLHSFHLCGPTIVLLVWLGISRLLLFSFNLGPLSPPPPSLFHFISLACLPVRIQQHPPRKTSPIHHSATKVLPSKTIVLAVKALLLGMIIHAYKYRPYLHPYVILALYCCHMYLGLEVFFPLIATPVQALGFELEPQSNEPYLSTSLQDFWGRRWNLMVTNILRPTVYDPTRRVCARVVGERWSTVSALLATFAVSGLMHDATYYYLTRVQPTLEVTWFFVLHGACVVAEVEVKKAVAGRWRLHPVVSRLLTLVFLAVTGNWLFFPQLLRNGVDTKAIQEYATMVDFVKANLPSNKS